MEVKKLKWQKHWFQLKMACRTPVCWSKYTTSTYKNIKFLPLCAQILIDSLKIVLVRQFFKCSPISKRLENAKLEEQKVILKSFVQVGSTRFWVGRHLNLWLDYPTTFTLFTWPWCTCFLQKPHILFHSNLCWW